MAAQLILCGWVRCHRLPDMLTCGWMVLATARLSSWTGSHLSTSARSLHIDGAVQVNDIGRRCSEAAGDGLG